MKDKGCVCILVRLVAKIGFDNVEKSGAKKLGWTNVPPVDTERVNLSLIFTGKHC